MKTMEQIFERGLWGTRLLVLVAVLASVLVGLGMLVVTSVDVLYVSQRVIQYLSPALDSAARSTLRLQTVGLIIEIVDGYLLSAVLLIFALGLYELFISKIEAAERSEFAGRLLLIRSLDDLKDRLAKVVVLMLVVKFFQQALQLKYAAPLDLLYLAIGIVLVGGALWLTHK